MSQLHFFFFPLMAHGHMIPTLDMAKLVASRGVKATIITTPLNESVFSDSIHRNKNLGIDIGIRLIKFKAVENDLPQGCERLDLVPSPELINNFSKALAMMQEPFENLVEECRPNCIVTDMLFPWTIDSAAKFNIPRIVFHGTSFFALCVGGSISRNKPFKNVTSDSDMFVVPDLPHQIKMTRTQLSPFDLIEKDTIVFQLFNEIREADSKSYGVIFNSFSELEPDYVKHYKVQGKKCWAIGPLSLCNRDIEDKTERGMKSSIDKNELLNWLDSKESSSIFYICFGSGANFTAAQIQELAMGIEDSGQEFIWVARKDHEVSCLPVGFGERSKEKGLIIRGWAPQVLILDHKAIGAFVTHCGWNSTLEGISAGVPMVTWPLFAEQFFNEKLVTEVLRIGAGVGSVQWAEAASEGVKREEICKAIKRVMVGEEAEGFRNRAKHYQEMARQAIVRGGSSYIGLTNLLQDITSYSSTGH